MNHLLNAVELRLKPRHGITMHTVTTRLRTSGGRRITTTLNITRHQLALASHALHRYISMPTQYRHITQHDCSTLLLPIYAFTAIRLVPIPFSVLTPFTGRQEGYLNCKKNLLKTSPFDNVHHCISSCSHAH